MKRVLIDCDILRYSHGSIQMRHPFLEGEFIPAPSDQICKLVDGIINHTLEACGTTDYVCVLSGKGNFRTELAKQVEYKGNRNPSQTRPYHFETVGDHIIKNHPNIVVDGHEADDYMGYTQYEDWHRFYESDGFDIDPDGLGTIIASRDKDLRTVQGWHYSWSCGPKQPEKPLYYIPPDKGMYQFFYQMLIGDNTDNIIGCGRREMCQWGKDAEGNPKFMLRRKGIGDKTAVKILNGCKSVKDMKETVFQEYEEFFKEEYEEILLENARLLFIGQKDNKLFEWSWLDKYLELENGSYVDPSTIPKRTRKRKSCSKNGDSAEGEPDPGSVQQGTPIPTFLSGTNIDIQ